jgi:hypothetical protein
MKVFCGLIIPTAMGSTFPPNQNLLLQQLQRIRGCKVRAYQTSLIFNKSRTAKQGLKLLTFLGIAVPLLAGGIVTSLYTDSKPPVVLLAVAGLIGMLQTLGSVWALVDHWEEKARLNTDTAVEADRLRIELETFKPDASDSFNEDTLQGFERRSYGGVLPDGQLAISEDEKKQALEKAEARYPPVTAAP